MRNPLFVASLAGAFLLPAVGRGAAWSVDAAHTSLTFKVRHMMITDVVGTFGKVSGSAEYEPGKADQARLEITVEPASIDTRDAQRDGHLCGPDFFDVTKYPTVTFKSTGVEPSGQGGLKVKGKLTIRGVTREVVLDVRSVTQEALDPWGSIRMGATATAVIKRKDFGMVWNKTLDNGGLLVGEEVFLSMEVELVRPAKKS